MSKECEIRFVSRFSDLGSTSSSVEREIKVDAADIVQGRPLPGWPVNGEKPMVDWYDGETVELSFLGRSFSMRAGDRYLTLLSAEVENPMVRQTRDVEFRLAALAYVRNDDFEGMFRRGSFDAIVYNFLSRDISGSDEDLAALNIFLRVFWLSCNIHLLGRESLELVRSAAESGSWYGLFAYGRCLCVLRPGTDWGETSVECFRKAAEAGLSDAYVGLSDAWYYGDLGHVDYGKSRDYMQKALDGGSVFAARRTIRTLIYGDRIMGKNPKAALEMLREAIKAYPGDPMWQFLRGCATVELEGPTKGREDFEYAAENGVIDAWVDLAMAVGCNDEYEMTDSRAYDRIIEKGAGRRSAACLFVKVFTNEPDPSHPYFSERRRDYVEGLEKSAGMGCNLAAVALGDLYLKGRLEIEADYGKAWSWYSRAALMGEPEGYEKLYGMLRDGLVKEDQDFMDGCAIRGVFCGSDSLLKDAVDIYRAGRLTMFAHEMEQYFIPMLEAQEKAAAEAEEEDEDDYPDDDGFHCPQVVFLILNPYI